MLRKASVLILLFIFAGLFNASHTYSQDKWWKNKKYRNESTREKYELCKKTFKDVSYGFLYNNVNYMTPYFDSQVYLNIASNDKGYYSSAQAEQILINFMDYFTIRSFKYTRSSRFNTYAFVNGTYTYMIGSGKRNLDVAISLKYYGNKWYIDQISIN